MSDMPPTVAERDRYLDELVAAYSQGRIDAAEFGRSSDLILSGNSRADLDRALANVLSTPQPRIDSPPSPYGPQHQHGYQPQPLMEAAHQHSASHVTSRRKFFLLGGSVAFFAVAGIGIVVASRNNSHPSYPEPDEPYYSPEPMNFLEGHSWYEVSSLLEGAISRIVITAKEVEVWLKPPGQAWQKISLDQDHHQLAQESEPGTNIFDEQDIELDLLHEIISQSAQKLGGEVQSVEIIRPELNTPVRFVVKVLGGGQATWDAKTGALVELKPA